MKIVISNTTLLNTGDAAIVDATIAILREAFGPDIEIVCYDAHAAVAARCRTGLTVRPRLFDQVAGWAGGGMLRKAALLWVLLAARLTRAGIAPRALPLPGSLRRTLVEYRDADIVISAGGTYLVPHYRLEPQIFDFMITASLGRPLVLFTQSLGPFPEGRARRLLRRLLRRAALVLLRDEPSRHHLSALGVPESRIALCADAAFALAPIQREFPPLRRGRPPRVAVSVRDWPHFDGAKSPVAMAAYLDAMAGFVARIVAEEKAQITFISTCQGAPGYWTDDSRIALEVVDRLSQDVRARVAVDRNFRSPAELIERLSAFDVVVATRMHVGILALCAGVPVIPIAYEFKTRELAWRLGLGELLQDIETICADGLMTAWQTLRDNADVLEPALWRRVEIARRSAVASGRLVREAIQAAP